MRSFRGCRSGRRVKERKIYSRYQNAYVQYSRKISISPDQNNILPRNSPSYFPIPTQISNILVALPSTKELFPNQAVYNNTRNLNNLISITPSKLVSLDLTCDKLIETENISVNTGHINIFHLNIRSLRNKAQFIQLQELASLAKFDIIMISETWLNTSVTSAEVKIDRYKLIRLDRLHKRGGGVCAYIRKDLKSTLLKDLSYISERNFHQLWISVQCKKTSFNLCNLSPRRFPAKLV